MMMTMPTTVLRIIMMMSMMLNTLIMSMVVSSLTLLLFNIKNDPLAQVQFNLKIVSQPLIMITMIS